MSGDSECLLVVGIIEGRHFPKLKNDDEVYVEAKFSSRSLTTDLVPAQENPSFNCELVFELLRKDLQLHRLNRTPVKLQLFAKGPSVSALTSPVGQIVLDLKQAKDHTTEPVWFPILHCKHRGNRPDLLISFYIETPKQQHAQYLHIEPAKPDVPIPTSIPSSPVSSLRPEPVSNKSETIDQHQISLKASGNYYIFNRDGDVGRLFRLTVTLVFAERLELLKTPTLTGPFVFYYYLLGNQVCTEPFQNLDSPEFPAERATVRIKCLRNSILNYISELNHLDVFLVSRLQGSTDTVIGKANVPLYSLITDGVAEGIYPVGERYQNMPLKDAPCVGLSLTLQLEETNESPSSHSEAQNTYNADKNTLGNNSTLNSTVESSKDSIKSVSSPQNTNNNNEDAGIKNAPKIEISTEMSDDLKTDDIKNKQDMEETVDHLKPDLDGNSRVRDASEAVNVIPDLSTKHESAIKPSASVEKINDSLPHSLETDTESKKRPKTVSSSDTKTKDVDMHFCLSIDLRHIRFLQKQVYQDCYIQYSYPFVGASDNIKTATFNTSLHKIVIPDGQHTFCFVTNFSRLQEAFQRLPVKLELTTDGRTICSTHFNLEPLLNAPTTFFSQSEHVKGLRSTLHCRTLLENQAAQAIARISVYLSLDRLEGKVDSKCIKNVQHKQQSFDESRKIPVSNPVNKHLRQPTESELRVTLELELWREQQEELFRASLKKREEAHLSALAQEWKERDAERELLLKTRIAECQRLEEKLRGALNDLEMKELKMQRKVEWLQRKEDELKRNTQEFEKSIKEQEQRKMVELKREANEVEHIMREQIILLEQELKTNKTVLEKALASKSKYKKLYEDLQKDFLAVQNRLISATDPVSFSQLSPLSSETANVETEPKELIREQRELLDRERSDLRRIKQEVENLRSAFSDAGIPAPHATTSQENISRAQFDYLQGLIKERDMLLRTGEYTLDHRLIQQLDRHIEMARRTPIF